MFTSSYATNRNSLMLGFHHGRARHHTRYICQSSCWSPSSRTHTIPVYISLQVVAGTCFDNILTKSNLSLLLLPRVYVKFVEIAVSTICQYLPLDPPFDRFHRHNYIALGKTAPET